MVDRLGGYEGGVVVYEIINNKEAKTIRARGAANW